MNAKERKELAVSKIVLLVLAIVGILVVVWLAWLRPATDATGNVTSFKECAAAKNPILESYPAVCVTKDGQRFSNPDQHIQRLVVKEWSVSVLITGIQDASYTYTAADDTVTVTTAALDGAVKRIEGCKSGLRPITYERAKLGDPNRDTPGTTWSEEQLKERGVKAGDYYYFEKAGIETACMPDQGNNEVRIAQDMLTRIRAGFSSLQAE